MKPIFHYAALATAISLALSPAAVAEQPALTPFVTQPSQSDFGGVGLIQMPSARMNKEGEFSINYFDTDQYRRYSLSLQLFPWLETTVRYVDVRTRAYSGEFGVSNSFSGDQTYKDKGIDAKFRLLKESQWLPELSVGARDLGGTGLFASEFVAANKRLGPLDFTFGMGWGYLGSRDNISNPFCEAKDGFCERPTGTLGGGGKFDADKMFRGPAALFGGVEYQTPWQPLRLKLEYDSNDYQEGKGKIEKAGSLDVNTPINVGAVYRAFDWLDVHANYQRGNTFGFGITMRTNFNELTPSWNDVPHPDYDATQQPEADQADWGRLQTELTDNAGYKRTNIYQDDTTLVISGEQTKYRDRTEAQTRAAVLLANQVPSDIERVQLVERKKSLELTTQEFDMAALRLAADNAYIGANVSDAITTKEPARYANSTTLAEHNQRVRFGISPILKQSLGGPESFYMYQIGFNANVEADITQQWLASAGLYVNLLDNYDKWDKDYRGNTDVLPPVRTLVRKYVSDNPVRVDNLQLTWMDRVADGWYAQAYGGYFELMYAGVGSEVLYRPANSKWAIGANANRVKQRDYDSQFGMLDYTVNTGHVSAYLEMPWLDDTLLQVHAGQYLAGDKGATFDISHKFDSGVIAGAF
ncbi:MAG: YjbH domain-containing protein, partial [Oceanisphaera sp.]|uniref:YjbH domain-containing protein n=1 Tax=Oceanisphaera sp. TaxID=1929979 RepID=UPI003F97A59F